MLSSGEEGIDARLEERERLMAELQSRRQELLEAKEAMRASMAYQNEGGLHIEARTGSTGAEKGSLE